MADYIAIKVEHVSKDFKLPHEKTTSVKGAFTGLYRKKGKNFESQHALKDISFEVKKGEFFGIVGRNGSGKSTMLKILAGIYQPSEGKVYTSGKLVPFIELGVGFNPELTGRENVYLNGAMFGFSRNEVDDMYEDIVSFAELRRFMDQKLKNYSSGMQVRLAFSMAIRAQAEILLVDEVLAVGDADFQRKCFNYFRQLKKEKRTVVFVSHDMSAVREFCDRAILIEKNEIIASGKGSVIADKYTRLFIEGAADEENSKEVVVKAPTEPPRPPAEGIKRWGEKQLQITQIKLDKTLYTPGDDYILLDVTFEALKEYDGVVSGFGIKDAAGTGIFGTNTRIKKMEIPYLEPGQSCTIRWECPNILADGQHTFDITLHGPDGLIIYDWWEDAITFSVRREEKTAFPITPVSKATVSLRKDSQGVTR